jgi:hypothetical protein
VTERAQMTFYQGPAPLPPGKRMTLGRMRRMLAAISSSSLSKMHAGVIRAGVVEYADASGLWFTQQDEWAAVAGRDVKTVTAAVKAALECGLLFSAQRVFTSTGRAGTSLYFIHPHVWSKDWEAVRQEIDQRLLAVGQLKIQAPQTVVGNGGVQAPQTVVGSSESPGTANGAAEQGRTSTSSPGVTTPGESSTTREEEASSPLTGHDDIDPVATEAANPRDDDVARADVAATFNPLASLIAGWATGNAEERSA